MFFFFFWGGGVSGMVWNVFFLFSMCFCLFLNFNVFWCFSVFEVIYRFLVMPFLLVRRNHRSIENRKRLSRSLVLISTRVK